MAHSLSYQITLRQLLSSEAMAEAQILCGEDLLERGVTQVVTSLTPLSRAGSLVVTRLEAICGKDEVNLKDLAAVVVIKPLEPELMLDKDTSLRGAIDFCKKAQVPLIVLPSLGEPGQIADDIRMSFLRELKLSSARLHSYLLSTALEEGLESLVESVTRLLNRPAIIETADFKVLAAKNMVATPLAQQRSLTDQAMTSLKQHESIQENQTGVELIQIKIGRRLIVPIFLNKILSGYISVMLRPADDVGSIIEILHPASMAAMVALSHSSKGVSNIAVTQKSLLTDILSGRNLSAADLERLERHYGLDLCDGFWVFAVKVNVANAAQLASLKVPLWSDKSFITTEVEGTRVVVVPRDVKSTRTWQEEAKNVVDVLKNAMEQQKPNIQLGAARLAPTMLDLPIAYREARQALIVGSMVNEEKEFIVGYGELGVKRLLYLIIDHPELDRFYEENLAPLEAYDAEWESELIPSLRIYLEQGANLNSAARALYIHRHTLRYRLEQIAEILKVDIDSQEVLLNLQIAFLIKDMKEGSQANRES